MVTKRPKETFLRTYSPPLSEGRLYLALGSGCQKLQVPCRVITGNMIAFPPEVKEEHLGLLQQEYSQTDEFLYMVWER